MCEGMYWLTVFLKVMSIPVLKKVHLLSAWTAWSIFNFYLKPRLKIVQACQQLFKKRTKRLQAANRFSNIDNDWLSCQESVCQRWREETLHYVLWKLSPLTPSLSSCLSKSWTGNLCLPQASLPPSYHHHRHHQKQQLLFESPFISCCFVLQSAPEEEIICTIKNTETWARREETCDLHKHKGPQVNEKPKPHPGILVGAKHAR